MSSAPEPTVRPATASDADAVFRLLRAFATTCRPDHDRFTTVTFPGALHAAAEGRAEFLVAVRDSQVIGYAYAARTMTLFAGGTILELLELAVHTPQRGRGTGSRLVQAMQTRARAAADVELTVPTRRAGDFYRRLNFTETATFLKWPVPGADV